jgi:hypothetical protein
MGVAAGPALSNLDSARADRSERRRHVRMRGYIVIDDGTHHEINLLDLSYEGCRIETKARLKAGQAGKLSVLRRGAIDAVVRWAKGSQAGLAFVAEAAPSKNHSPRRHERISLEADVSLRRIGKAGFRVAVTDVSPDGCKVELVERPSLGERVLVKFDRLEPLEADVCWVEGHTAGLMFAKAIHPAVFELLVERLAHS